jgi:nucleoside-diphosphate-sugar epimerase
VSLRIFSVYGPRQKKLVIYDLIKKLNQNPENLTVQGDGTQMRDFIYIDDLIDALIIISKKAPNQGEVYNVASGTSVTILDLVKMICSVCGVSPDVQYTHQSGLGVPQKWKVDISNLLSLGYSPQTPLNSGLMKTLDWIKTISPESSL